MTKVSIKNINGEAVKDINLSQNVWGIEVNELTMKKAVKLQLDSLRQGTAKTKTRAEVSGGGKKPWKQKGTGRARQGSNRAPHWRGGGISMGVAPRDYTFKINRKERLLALRSALTEKATSKKLVIVDSLKLESLKTKEAVKFMSNLKLDGKVLFVGGDDAENLYMATRNLDNVLVIYPDELNVFDILNADMLVLDEESLNQIEEVLK